jgi:hypothetical protein
MSSPMKNISFGAIQQIAVQFQRCSLHSLRFGDGRVLAPEPYSQRSQFANKVLLCCLTIVTE